MIIQELVINIYIIELSYKKLENLKKTVLTEIQTRG